MFPSYDETAPPMVQANIAQQPKFTVLPGDCFIAHPPKQLPGSTNTRSNDLQVRARLQQEGDQVDRPV
jgi:hypothetical protein